MGKRNRSEPRERRSPIETVANYSDDFIEDLGIPSIPDQIPQRLEEAIAARVQAFLFRLREANKIRYVSQLEIRLVREAQTAVLTACELGLRDAEVWYATFRGLVEELGYVRAEAGYVKPRGDV